MGNKARTRLLIGPIAICLLASGVAPASAVNAQVADQPAVASLVTAGQVNREDLTTEEPAGEAATSPEPTPESESDAPGPEGQIPVATVPIADETTQVADPTPAAEPAAPEATATPETATVETAMAAAQFVAVTNLALPTGGNKLLVGQTLALNPLVVPTNATNKSISWSIVDARGTGAKLTGSNLTATAAGTITVKATIADGVSVGTPYMKEVSVSVTKPFAPVLNVAFPAGGNTFTAGQSLTLNPIVAPSVATNQSIAWSVVDARGTGARLNGKTLTATTAGTVVVRATIANGLAVGTPYVRDINIIVTKPTIRVNVPGTQNSTVGQSVYVTVPAATVSPSTIPLSYKVSNLPAGLRFDPTTRVISGCPTKAGNYTVTVQVSGGAMATNALHLESHRVNA